MKTRVPCTCYACTMHRFHSQAAELWVFCTCRNYEDAYSDPGSPVTRRTPQGSFVLAMVDDQKKLLMQGERMPACGPFVTTGAVCTQLLHLGFCLSLPACGVLLEVPFFWQDSKYRGQLLC